ncbi:MAG: adenylosuccinate lyase, partial [Candidatus Electrothrix sp. AUS3]|nr:adenylosuccinate lyase [Candidatus Electrothrix gigas]
QIERYLRAELPFMSTEKILMECVEKGESRQEMHEVIREHSVAAGLAVKEQGLENDLLNRLADDERIPFTLHELEGMIMNYQEFTGRAAEQTLEFLDAFVTPILKKYRNQIGGVDASLKV